MQRVVMIAGGTGGHIIPALAVADLLAAQSVDIHWLGSKSGLEQKLVSPHWPMTLIDAGRVRGKRLTAQLLAPFRLAWATGQALRAFRRLKPQLVIAMGGFVTAPGGLAAKLLGIPLVIHEQNSIAGYSNRLLARWARQLLTAYPTAFATYPQTRLVGNPVKSTIAALPLPSERQVGQHQPLRLLILGGSQGAKAINELVPQAFATFEHKAAWSVWHQTGVADQATVAAAYQASGVTAQVTAFIDDMAAAYCWADVVISRAGALTIAELTTAGLGSLLIPFPLAVDDHQWHNAEYLAAQQAALLFRQAEFTVPLLQQQLTDWLHAPEQLLRLAQNARSLAKPHAAEQVAQACLSLLI